MTAKQKFLKIVGENHLEYDVADYIGLQITVFSPRGYQFVSGHHSISSQVYYTCKNEIWGELLERLNNELPLIECNCEECKILNY